MSLPCNCPTKNLAGPDGRRDDDIQDGDIVVVTASLFDPFYAALGTAKPEDNFRRNNGSTIVGSRYSTTRSTLPPAADGSGASTIYEDGPDAPLAQPGKRRPAIVLETRADTGAAVTMSVCLMGTFEGVPAADISGVFKRYITHVYTDTMPDKKACHFHTSPEWIAPSKEQWVIPMSYEVTQRSAPPRWLVRRGPDASTLLSSGDEGYHLHDDALVQLIQLESRTSAYFDSVVAGNRSGQRSLFVEKLNTEYRRRHPTIRTRRRNPTKNAVSTRHTKRFSISHPTPIAISAY
ncbi:hypothetical protein BD626DRAFT_478037 [Schizophyllum amplum]|uniref:Uncharacterized protein n=1 Tax=Schizophyllum amplum TaxID=97359 RepID=A0A550D0R8_9AGAR|nr:hypothetical protein BD626DRAFT_478037 [Auriculariopsis ampla]